MRIRKSQLRRIIQKESARLHEYSEHPSHADLSDTLEDMLTVMDDVTMKYVDSGWLEKQDQKSLALDLEKLYEQINTMSHIFNQLAGRGQTL